MLKNFIPGNNFVVKTFVDDHQTAKFVHFLLQKFPVVVLTFPHYANIFPSITQ